jgi:hypothetical protein
VTRNAFTARVRIVSRAYVLACLGILPAACITACSSDVATPGFLGPEQQFWTFMVNARALTLSTVAPYDTFRLAVDPRDAKNAPFAGEIHSTFRVTSGSDNITVDSTGLVTALNPTVDRQARILVRVADRRTQHTDTVFVRVTPTRPVSPLAGLTLHLPPGVSSPLPSVDAVAVTQTLVSFFGLGGVRLVLDARDVSGDTIVDPWVSFTSSDSAVATVDSTGRVLGHTMGTATITASTTLYGVTRRDSLQLTFGLPQLSAFGISERTSNMSTTPLPYFLVGPQTVARGAVVYWLNQSGLTLSGLGRRPGVDVDITFDTPDAVLAVPDSLNPLHQIFHINIGQQGGNIPLLPADATNPIGYGIEARYFPQAGTYVFRSHTYPMLVDTLKVK